MIYIAFFLIAFLYSSVGLAGGSAYAGLLALLGVEQRFIPSTSQFLNIVVSLVGVFNYRVHLRYKGRIRYLVAVYILSIFGVLAGSILNLSRGEFYIVLGSSLILAGVLSLLRDYISGLNFKIPHFVVPFISFLLGFLTGIVGIGGGIFLSPVLLLAGFNVKEVASITSVYILLNSSVGFAVNFLRGNVNLYLVGLISIVVLVGGFAGSYLGSFKFAPGVVRKVLIAIIIIIGGQILWRGIT